MKRVTLIIWEFLGGNAFQVSITFLLSGFLAGAFFTWLTRLPAMMDFFFILGKMLEARFSWYVAFSSFLVLGVIIGFLVSLRQVNLIHKFRLTSGRSALACAYVIATMPLFYLLSRLALPLFDAVLILFVIPILILPMLSLAMCTVTRSLRLLPVAFLANIVSVIAALGFHGFTFWLLRNQGVFVVEFFEWAGLFSSLSLCFGLWLLGRARAD